MLLCNPHSQVAMTSVRIALIDYGAGNLHSAQRALEAGGAKVLVVSDPQHLAQVDADALVLPGVGAFDPVMRRIKAKGLRGEILEQAHYKPVLGICIGMQILFDGSEEGDEYGLGLVPGWIHRFMPQPGVVIPHMGWNQIKMVPTALSPGVAADPWVYFVHSYYPAPQDKSAVIATCQHGEQHFCAAVRVGNVWGTQFHPEKSGTLGLKILENFVADVACQTQPLLL